MASSPDEEEVPSGSQHALLMPRRHVEDERPAPVGAVPSNASVPKPKRLACMICRKRKLKCDGLRPSCSTCSRLGHMCAYDEHRRKSGPKRGYVKALEERLRQVETLLRTQDPSPPAGANGDQALQPGRDMGGRDHVTASSAIALPAEQDMSEQWHLVDAEVTSQPNGFLDGFNFDFSAGVEMQVDGLDEKYTWDMIGQGLEEPLPAEETVDELHRLYFEQVHPSMPMIHRARYLAAMSLAPNQRPPVCLRYAMWTLASSVTDQFSDLKESFYQRARKYVEADYGKGYGEHMITLAHCQAHILLACYEMKMMYFPRAWINTGSAVRLAQMIGLHRLDGAGLDVKLCFAPPKDWTEREERRRTFWMAFCEDRYASIGTGWPMTIDERDIMTNLPASDEAFESSKPEATQTLPECTRPAGAERLSSLGGVVLTACLFGRNLVHLHRPSEHDLDHDLNGPFWQRHRQMDGILLDTVQNLPAHLNFPAGLPNPNAIFTNMSIHTSAICLHQAAIFKAEKNKLPISVSGQSKVRCISAASEIASMMRTIAHLDLSNMNPFISFCLYVAARVFVQYLKSRQNDLRVVDSLQFLLTSMNTLKKRNPLTESFLVQLDVDFEALAARIPKLRDAVAEPAKGDVREPRPRPGKQVGTTADLVQGHQENGGALERNSAPLPSVDVSDPQIPAIFNQRDPFVETDGDESTIPVSPGLVEAGRAYTTTHQTTDFAQAWFPQDQQPMTGLTPASASVFEKDSLMGVGMASSGFGATDDNNANAGASADNGSLTGLTASTSGADMNNAAPRATAVPGTDQTTYQAGSVPSRLPDVPSFDAGTHPRYFVDAGALSAPSNEAAQHGSRFPARTNGWSNVPGSAPSRLHPAGDGVLRALMNMGPMDAMDLSSWDPAADTNMRG